MGSTVGSPPSSTSPTSRQSLVTSFFAQRWQSSMLRSLQNFQERVAKRTRRRKKRSLRRKKKRNQRRKRRPNLHLKEMVFHCLSRRRILWMSFPLVHSTWRNGRGSTPTMTKMTASNGSGNTSTLRTTPSGEEITSTTTNLPWSSCPVISLEVCSRG